LPKRLSSSDPSTNFAMLPQSVDVQHLHSLRLSNTNLFEPLRLLGTYRRRNREPLPSRRRGWCQCGTISKCGLRFDFRKMLSTPVVNIGWSLKTCSKPLPDVVLPLKARAKRFTPSWHFQHAIIRKESHDPIQIVRIKRITDLFQLFSNIHLHGPISTPRRLTPP
jgi:hypothetical protein